MDREHAEQEVVRLADVWIAAELRGDSAFLERMLADDFVAVGPLGFMLTKREWIGRHESGNMKYDALDLDEVTVRIYGQAAVLIGRKVQDAAYRGNSVKAQLRTTVVLVHQGGDWQLVGVHMSPITPPPSFVQQQVRDA
jgi:ketosteroid isomerase-like protein